MRASILGSRSWPAAATLWLCCRLAAAGLVVNEICYDPPGADAGAEFVELINCGLEAVELTGCRLEFANGAVGPVWAVRWAATAGARLEPGQLFLVVDRGWTGTAADAEVSLGLQNGPDALRLVRGDGSIDLVGWGALAWGEMYEHRPHPGAAGRSLARRPDGNDSGDNAADFVAADPTPGARNWAAFAAALHTLRWEPPSLPAAHIPATAHLQLTNSGLHVIEDATLELQVGTAAADWMISSWPVAETLALALTIVPLACGLQSASLLVRGVAAADTCRLALGQIQVGPSEVRLSEVMGAPITGGEWCELVNTGPVARNLAELALRDEDGAWRRLPERTLEPGECLLLAQDAAALTAWLQDLAALALLICQPQPPMPLANWPLLNNTAPAGRDFADRLYLGDPEGTVLDHVTMGLGSGLVPVGRSYERAPDSSWQPSRAAQGGTPGCLPPPPPCLAAGELRFSPNPYGYGDGDGVLRIHVSVPESAAGWTLRLYDLWGRLVRDLGGDDLGPGQRLAVWDGTDESGRSLGPGGYIGVLHWRQAGGSLTTATRRLLVIREGRP